MKGKEKMDERAKQGTRTAVEAMRSAGRQI